MATISESHETGLSAATVGLRPHSIGSTSRQSRQRYPCSGWLTGRGRQSRQSVPRAGRGSRAVSRASRQNLRHLGHLSRQPGTVLAHGPGRLSPSGTKKPKNIFYIFFVNVLMSGCQQSLQDSLKDLNVLERDLQEKFCLYEENIETPLEG